MNLHAPPQLVELDAEERDIGNTSEAVKESGKENALHMGRGEAVNEARQG